ncbi:MAG: alpha/beta hydrolase fold domain-containing protein [Xenococcaceae cyanobacterium]
MSKFIVVYEKFFPRYYYLAIVVVLIFFLKISWATLSTSLIWTLELDRNYNIHANITYAIASDRELKLDLYERKTNKPNPTVLFIHGGGWSDGSKEEVRQDLLPYLQIGFSAVNIEYRLAQIAKAPAALEDCLCALSWIAKNGDRYNLDPQKIVAIGQSAGGHLALLASTISPEVKLTPPCQQDSQFNVAAIVNWFGISDLKSLIEESNSRDIALFWLGKGRERDLLASQLSPIDHIRQDTPPILSIHGDADPIVPYSQSLRLHQVLDRAHVPNQLITVPGGKHGDFDFIEMEKINRAIEQFLSTIF